VTGVESVHHVVLSAVASIEIVRTNGVSLESDAKQLSLETRLHSRQFLGENLVETVLQDFAVAQFLHREVLASVVNPYVHDTRVVLEFTHSIGDTATTLSMLNPEIADLLVRISESKVSALRVRERSRVEVEFQVMLLCPLHPALEVLHLNLVAVNKLSAEFSVGLVQVQTEGSGKERFHLINILAQLIDIASLSRIVSCGLDTARCCHVALKADNVVCLPAVERYRSFLESLDSLVCIDTKSGVALFSHFVGFSDLICFHFSLGFILLLLILMGEMGGLGVLRVIIPNS